jgi:hypothetical protein
MQRAFLRAFLFQKVLIGFSAACFVVPIVAGATVKPGTYLLLYVLFPLLLLIAIAVTTAAMATAMLRKAPSLRSEISMSITGTGLNLILAKGEAMRTWDRFKVVAESRNFYFAQPKDRRGYVPLFPKRALRTPDDEQAFRMLADGHTKSRLSKIYR